MGADASRTQEVGDAIGHALVGWLHQFRSLHGEVYAVALAMDSSGVSVRAFANTEAHYRSAIAEVQGEHERLTRRWSPAHWVPSESGADFDHLNAVLTVGAWHPSFDSFRSMVIEAMYRGVRYAVRDGALGDRKRSAKTCVFLLSDDHELRAKLQRESAKQFNTDMVAAELLLHLGP
jgi:hypothetical protein